MLKFLYSAPKVWVTVIKPIPKPVETTLKPITKIIKLVKFMPNFTETALKPAKPVTTIIEPVPKLIIIESALNLDLIFIKNLGNSASRLILD